MYVYIDQRLNLGKNLPNDDEAVRGQLIGKRERFQSVFCKGEEKRKRERESYNV